MELLVQTLTWVVVGLIAAQAFLLAGYAIFLYRFRRPALRDEDCARAAVILCVRGLDPFLPATLKGLFHQDYPDYDVWIVVDSVRDPAWPIVNKVALQSGKHNIHILPLTDRLSTSSRKISGMLQAMAQIDDSYEIVALLDSDTIPHASWLRQLATPLRDPRVGIASGNRWYMPARPSAGSLVLYLWNAAAVVQMYWYGIGWGGSLAIKGEFLRNSDLRKRLMNAFGEDNASCRCAAEHGYRVAFAPSLIMVNRESATIKGVLGFLQRQMLSVRLHNPWWWAVVLHGVSTTGALGLACLTTLAAAASGSWAAAGAIGTALATYWASMVLLILPVEWCVRRIVHDRDEPITRVGLVGWLRIALAVPLAQVVHFRAMLAALFARSHLWRGVRYQFNGTSPVQVVEDQSEAA